MVQQEPAAAGAAAAPAYCAGAVSNFVSQPREQKWYVSPFQVDEPTAFAGSMVIPQTGSVTVVVAVVKCFICVSFTPANAVPAAVLHLLPNR